MVKSAAGRSREKPRPSSRASCASRGSRRSMSERSLRGPRLRLSCLRLGRASAATFCFSPRSFPRCSPPGCRSIARSPSPANSPSGRHFGSSCRTCCACSRAASRWGRVWARIRITFPTCTSIWCAPARLLARWLPSLSGCRNSSGRAMSCATTLSLP